MTEREVFLEALERGTSEARAAYLLAVCGRNSPLRLKVEELLKEHFSNDSLLAGAALEGEETTVASPEAATPMLGRYKLLEKLGEGGFGEVWMAEQREPVKRRVALKIIKPGMDSRQIVARFEAERQALAMMDHPNIAKILDAGTTDPHPPARQEPLRHGEGPGSGHPLPSDGRGAGGEGSPHVSLGRPYFVMELVRGIKITEYCDQNQLPTADRLKLFILVCQAIQHAHQKGIIHRDIKPSNILVTLHDGVPVPKVIDFGIAKATQQELTDKTVFTQFQQFMGTPAYISPEQAEMSGLDIDTRADIYSLGVLLYELLVGQTPFDAREMMRGGLDALRQIIREKEPLSPSTKLNTLPGEARTTAGKRRQTEVNKLIHQLQGDLDWIVMKCLEKDRTRRYDTAIGLAADLRRHLHNEPVVARPPTTAYRFQKAFRRNKLVFAAGAGIWVALVLGVIGTSIGLLRTEKQRQAAEQRQTEAEAERRRAEIEQQRADVQALRASENEKQSRRLLYAADMNLAQQALKLNNLGRARRLLDRHRPQPDEEDLRGWEWRYLWQVSRSSALVTLTNRPTRGVGLSFSPDGNRLAVGWLDGHVDLWDVPARRLVRALTPREYSHQGRVAFSPVRNLLAATSEPKVVTLYDLDSGRESILWHAPDQGAWEVRALEFSQDGLRLVLYAGIPSAKIYGGSTIEPGDQVGDQIWVMNVASSQSESHHRTDFSAGRLNGAALLSPDNQRLYLARSDRLNYRYSIQCIELSTGKELWQTPRERGAGLTALAISPGGRVLVSGSGYEDSTIRVWDATTGLLLRQLDGHTASVHKLAFSTDGRRLLSASGDQSVRFWDTSNWSETHVLRGHTDEVHAVAISKATQLVASTGKDGDLILWKEDGKSAADVYSHLPENLQENEVLPLDRARVLLLAPGKPPELIDLMGDSPPRSLSELGYSTNFLGLFGTNVLCYWNGTNQILFRELCGPEFRQLGAISLGPDKRPPGLIYNVTCQLVAWTEGSSPEIVYLASLAAPARRIELRSDVSGLIPFRFSEDGDYLVAKTKEGSMLRAWNVKTRQIVTSIDGILRDATFAADERVLVVAMVQGHNHEIGFYDLVHPDRPPRHVPGRTMPRSLAVSPDGAIVALSNEGGQVRLFDPAKGEWIEDLHGHVNAAHGIAFSPAGRRLISSSGGRETVKLWDVSTRQELLTLGGTGSLLYAARWSADGDVILAGPPWQAWRAPSWEEIAAAEAKENTKIQRP